MDCHSRKNKNKIDYRPVLYRIARALEENNLLKLESIIIMSNDFGALSDAVDRIKQAVLDVAVAIRNPEVDNNDQSVIDDLTSRLVGAANALDAATAEENAMDAGLPTETTPPTEEPDPAPPADETPAA